MAGSSSGGNSASTTVPMTCATLPFAMRASPALRLRTGRGIGALDFRRQLSQDCADILMEFAEGSAVGSRGLDVEGLGQCGLIVGLYVCSPDHHVAEPSFRIPHALSILH